MTNHRKTLQHKPNGRYWRPWPLLTSILLLSASPAMAVQHHGGAEGLISHQIGHLLFITGTAFLLFHIYRDRLSDSGWPEFKWFLWLIILWNILTFTGHWLYELTNPATLDIIKNHPPSFAYNHGRSATINNLTDAIFYLTRLDHFLLVPALFLLLKALRKWNLRP